MAAAVAGILTLAVLTVGMHQAFASLADDNKQNDKDIKVALGGNGGSGGAGGAGGEGGTGGTNFVKDTRKKADVDQDANGGNSNGGHGGNANGGFAVNQ
jgi:hypothetical protein